MVLVVRWVVVFFAVFFAVADCIDCIREGVTASERRSTTSISCIRRLLHPLRLHSPA